MQRARWAIVSLGHAGWIRASTRLANVDNGLTAFREHHAGAIRCRTPGSDEMSENRAWNEASRDEQSEKHHPFDHTCPDAMLCLKLVPDPCTRGSHAARNFTQCLHDNVAANRPGKRLCVLRFVFPIIRLHATFFSFASYARESAYRWLSAASGLRLRPARWEWFPSGSPGRGRKP